MTPPLGHASLISGWWRQNTCVATLSFCFHFHVYFGTRETASLGSRSQRLSFDGVRIFVLSLYFHRDLALRTRAGTLLHAWQFETLKFVLPKTSPNKSHSQHPLGSAGGPWFLFRRHKTPTPKFPPSSARNEKNNHKNTPRRSQSSNSSRQNRVEFCFRLFTIGEKYYISHVLHIFSNLVIKYFYHHITYPLVCIMFVEHDIMRACYLVVSITCFYQAPESKIINCTFGCSEEKKMACHSVYLQ